MTMLLLRLTLLLAFAACTSRALDLGPVLRLGQCRAQCLKAHSLDGSCEWWRHGETGCNECWLHCDLLEKKFSGHDDWASVQQSLTDSYPDCNDNKYKQCPSCRTACDYWKYQVMEEYLPSMLPAPRRGRVSLGKNDVAIMMHKSSGEWRSFGYYPGLRAPGSLRQDEWLLVVSTDNAVLHYSWEEWTPRLESLKPGPLYEATISWRDIASQLKRQQAIEQKRFNDKVRQFFLERYGEKVLERRNQDEEQEIPEEVFKRFFFRRGEEARTPDGRPPVDEYSEPSTLNSDDAAEARTPHGAELDSSSFVVSWEPETGGLMGNQLADSNTAQISLLPGVKYWVRIASNDGPGSFPIEVDTRSSPSVQILRITRKLEHMQLWTILAGCGCALGLLLLLLFLATKLCKLRSSKTLGDEEPEEEMKAAAAEE